MRDAREAVMLQIQYGDDDHPYRWSRRGENRGLGLGLGLGLWLDAERGVVRHRREDVRK